MYETIGIIMKNPVSKVSTQNILGSMNCLWIDSH